MSVQQELDAFNSKPVELKDLQTVIELQNKRIKQLEQMKVDPDARRIYIIEYHPDKTEVTWTVYADGVLKKFTYGGLEKCFGTTVATELIRDYCYNN